MKAHYNSQASSISKTTFLLTVAHSVIVVFSLVGIPSRRRDMAHAGLANDGHICAEPFLIRGC